MKYPQSVSMPSAVSDWLEEQLEARGIDAVVYTRYILSLLHTHTIDVIYPDEDLQFSRLRKEVGRSAGARKRFRRTSDWWRYAQANAEQIKRSAAVECLMSASDQNCEIESLVDELCEKLKEVDSNSLPDLSNVKELPAQKISPKELAEKYYAAFPPLCPANETIVTILPKWLPNPSPKKSKRKQKRQPYDNKFHSETMRQRTGPARQRFGPKKQSCVRNLSKEMADNITNWSLCEKNEDQRLNTRNDPDEDVHMYDDLPVDISELLEDSPSLSPHEETVDLMNMANMRDTGRNNEFISCGTNIISSIWSNNDQNKIENENSLDLKFSSISIDAATSWPDFDKQNETNAMLEKKKTSVFEVFHGLPDVWGGKDVKDADLPFENEHLFDRHTVSLMKLNHSKERSGFVEISPKTKCNTQTFNPFSQSSSLFCFNRKNVTFDKEDLLTSERSHFKPINEKTQGEYEDGATFVINNKLDKVEYRRSESGSMYLQNEFGQTKKYREYKNESDEEFVLKYCVVQNDKACQTEEVTMEDGCPIISGRVLLVENQEAMEDAELDCEVDEFCSSTSNRPDSVLGEVTWKYELKSCDQCNNNNVAWDAEWNGREKIGSEWDCDSLRNIWDGGKVCNSCLRLNGGCTPPTTQNNQLREDISQDGEQLLSDLSTLQKCYMENMPTGDYEVLPYEERKRRRSFMEDGAQNGSSWSFASRLAEDCLITMSTMPTLRSVTL